MKAKNTFFVIIITALLTCLITNTVRDAMHTQSHKGLDRKLNTVIDIIDNYSIYDINEELMADNAATAIANSISDPYTNYFSKDKYTTLTNEIRSSYLGVGIMMNNDAATNKLMIVSTIEGQIAEKSGVLAGDYILAVDGVKYNGKQLDEAADAIQGANLKDTKGTAVTLTLERNGTVFDITMTRGVIVRETVSSKMLQDGIGYMRISQFNSKNPEIADSEDTYDEFVKKFEEINGLELNSLIIDLRNNPGGDLDVVTKIADYILPSGVVTYTEDKNGKKRYYESTEELSLDIPMVLLVNSGSASASEVLSGALKDYNKAELVGEKTFGKGVVQTVIPLYDGSGLTVTSAKYYTPSGKCIHEKGIEPDVLVTLEIDKSISQLTYEEDLQLQKAVEILKNK